jgi:GT2 family glycosyltransferase
VALNQSEKVSVIIPNYNGGERIVPCIKSILAQTYQPIELVIIDNASSDGSLDLIRKQFPNIRLIETGYNAGWGIACNVGMKATTGKYIALLNNDAFLEKDCVAQMVKAINRDPKFGSCASRILLWDQKDVTEVCGLVIHEDGSSCGRGRLGPADQYMKIEEVFCANDCCCLYRREMIDDVGDYDPDFFIYCDETDIGWKHQLAGWKCVYAPDAVAYHAHSRAAGSYSPFKAYHVERNRIFIAIKYFPFWMFVSSFFIAAYRYLYQWYLSAFEKKGALAHYRKEHSLLAGLRILLKAHWDALRKFPVMWRRRRSIQKTRRITHQDIRALFKRYGISTRDMASYE